MEIVTGNTTQNTRKELMNIWRTCLTRNRYNNPYEGVIDELSKYFELPTKKVRWICRHSAEMVAEEWRKTGLSTTPQEVYNFYKVQTYWLFGTLRYHANQTDPHAVIIADAFQHLHPEHHLDFGCGAATTSLFFNALGWKTSLGDVSESAVNFARWRFEQRKIQGTFYNLETDRLPSNTYDLITAFDVMAHVDDISGVLHRLHQSLKPGGYLVFNIDSRKPTPMTIWHLYDAHYPVIRNIRQVGFRRLAKIPPYPLYCYQKIDRSPLNAATVGFLDRILHNRFESKVSEQIQRLVLRRIGKLLHSLKETN